MASSFSPQGLGDYWRRLPRRGIVLGAALGLLALVGLGFWLTAGRPVAVPAPPGALPRAPDSRPADSGSEAITVIDIFSVRTWEPESAEYPATAAGSAGTAPGSDPAPIEPEPSPPALPFRFLGRIVEAGKAPAFMLLGAAGETLIVRVGDSLGGDYRVEAYQDGKLIFLYLPMNLHQTLAIGEPP
jgi:hypothetical protein